MTRHSLADQLASLTEELVPTGKGKQRTLLEELEDLHIKLSELKSTRTYVAVIEKALGLRCAHRDMSFVIDELTICLVAKMLSPKCDPLQTSP